MIQLSIDTCNSPCAVALSVWKNGAMTMLASNTQDIGRGHAEVLTDQVADILREANLKPKDLARIAVTTGPGSFTGQRVGLSTARTLASTLKTEIVGVGVLDALLLEAKLNAPAAQAYCAISNAKRNCAYVKAIAGDETVLIEASLLSVDDLSPCIAKLVAPLALVGSGVFLIDEKLSTSHTCVDIAYPSIGVIALLGHCLNALQHPAEPLYLRDADAKPQSAKHVLRMVTKPANEARS